MAYHVGDLAENTLLVVGALFPIVNPIGNTPIFLSLTRGLSGKGRTALARMIALNGLALILASIFIGTHILAFFGISLPVVQVGGGLVVISTGWALLRHSDDETDGKNPQKECNETDYSRQAFYPLTLPLTVGPGSISVAITVGANRTEGSEWRWTLIAGMLLGSLLIAAFHLPELPVCRTDWTHPWRLCDERDHSPLVVHPGVHRGSDPMEWIECFASHHRSMRAKSVTERPAQTKGLPHRFIDTCSTSVSPSIGGVPAPPDPYVERSTEPYETRERVTGLSDT